MEKKEYLIGDVATLMGISRDTLRFYEKKGILSPHKKANGYRYYTADDLFELSGILYHRKMNIGLEEIENLWSGTHSYQKNAKVAQEKTREEEALIRQHQQALLRLRLFQEECCKIEANLNRISLRSLPEAYIVGSCHTLAETPLQWFSLSQKIPGLDMSYTYDSFSYDSKTSDKPLTFCHSRLLLYKELVQPLLIHREVEAYPQSRPLDCLYTIVESPSRIPDVVWIEKLLAWGEAHGYQTSNQVISDYIMHGMNDGDFTFYLEIYIPLYQDKQQTAFPEG